MSNEPQSTKKQALTKDSTETIHVESEESPSKQRMIEEECELLVQKNTPKQHDSFGTPTILSDEYCKKCGKEEESLNAMIRRLVAMELMRYCEKERTVINRAFSDTYSAIDRKRNKYKKQAMALSFPPLVFTTKKSFQSTNCQIVDQCNPVLSAAKIEIENDPVKSLVPEEVPEEKVHDIGEQAFPTNDCSSGVEEVIVDNSLLILDDPDESLIIDHKVTDVQKPEDNLKYAKVPSTQTREKKYNHASTQTKHAHVIRNVRSCPGRDCRQLHLQLHRLVASRGSTLSRIRGQISIKAQWLSLDLPFPELPLRKASDNLIYKKGKARTSPSYISTPERFRWRYVTPSKAHR